MKQRDERQAKREKGESGGQASRKQSQGQHIKHPAAAVAASTQPILFIGDQAKNKEQEGRPGQESEAPLRNNQRQAMCSSLLTILAK